MIERKEGLEELISQALRTAGVVCSVTVDCHRRLLLAVFTCRIERHTALARLAASPFASPCFTCSTPELARSVPEVGPAMSAQAARPSGVIRPTAEREPSA